jgi:hypothetical protein
MSIPVAVPSKVLGIRCSKPADGMDVRLVSFFVWCVGSGLWDDLIPRPEESHLCVWSRSIKNRATCAAGLGVVALSRLEHDAKLTRPVC